MINIRAGPLFVEIYQANSTFPLKASIVYLKLVDWGFIPKFFLVVVILTRDFHVKICISILTISTCHY